MKKLVIFMPLISLLFVSCYAGTGANYSSILGISVNTHPTPEYNRYAMNGRFGIAVHINKVPGQIGQGVANPLKQGRACSQSLLFLVATGDSSIETAKKDGSITKIAFIEHEIRAFIFSLYHEHCTIVHGI